VRAFVRLRELAISNADLAKRPDELEHKTKSLALAHDTFSRNTRKQRKQVFDTLRELMAPPDPPRRPSSHSDCQSLELKTAKILRSVRSRHMPPTTR
jgi:hypothetical protein